VLVTIGQHDDGSPFVATHVRCPAVAFPDIPKQPDPAWAAGHPRTVVVHAVVMPGGHVDSATVRVDDGSDERYAEAAMSSVSQMRFVPAEFDGVKVPAPIEIVLPFGTAVAQETAESP
jgi:Gram-negative bacterial TonB protein C-terminal